jgi:hypothetical protein
MEDEKLKLLKVRPPKHMNSPVFFELKQCAIGGLSDLFQFKSIDYACRAKLENECVKVGKYRYAVDDIGDLGQLFENAEEGEIFRLKIIMMSRKDFESLAEYEGP